MNKLNLIIHTLYLLKGSADRTPQIDEEKILQKYRQPAGDKAGITIKVLSVFGGIASSLFFLAFLFLADLYDSEAGMLVFGIFCVVAAIFSNSRINNLLVDTAGVSFYLAGLFLIGGSLASMRFNEYHICLIFIAIAILTQFIIQNYVFAFIALLLVNGSITAMFVFAKTNNMIHILLIVQVVLLMLLFFFEAAIICTGNRVARIFPAVRTGMVVSLLAGLLLVCQRDLFYTSGVYTLITGLVIILALLYTAFRLIDLFGVKNTENKALIYTVAGIMCIPTIAAPAISGSLLIILLCFFVRHRGGFILAMLCLIYSVSQYYYDLRYTLLIKSFFLMGSGVLFILIYMVTAKKLVVNAKV